MAVTISKTFSSAIAGDPLLVRSGDTFNWAVSGTFAGTWVLEGSPDGKNWGPLPNSNHSSSLIGTMAKSGSFKNEFGMTINVRFRCSAYTSGSMVTSIVEDDPAVVVVADRNGNPLITSRESSGSIDMIKRTSQKRLSPANLGHVGATAGFVVRAASDTDLATVPASQSASTLVIPIGGLKVGDTITGFHLIGELTSGGGSVTVDCSLYKHTAGSGSDPAASIQAMAQLVASANQLFDEVATLTQLSTPEVVAQDKSYFYLVKVTTASACTVSLQAAATVVTET